MTKAWKAACAVAGSKVVISARTYKLGAMTLLGPCKGAFEFQLQGTLQAPSNVGKDFGFLFNVSTISLCQVVKFLMAKDKQQGKINNCAKNYNCKTLPIVRFQS